MTLRESISFDSGILSSCPFLRGPLLNVADEMRNPWLSDLTKRHGARQWVLSIDEMLMLVRLRCGRGDAKNRKPSRSAVTACLKDLCLEQGDPCVVLIRLLNNYVR